jgi:hypothetical protein
VVLQNLGPAPYVIKALRLNLSGEPACLNNVWFRQSATPTSANKRTYAVNFVIAGRSAVSNFCEFTGKIEHVRLSVGLMHFSLQGLVGNATRWKTLGQIAISIDRSFRDDQSTYRAYDNLAGVVYAPSLSARIRSILAKVRILGRDQR